MMQQIRKDEGEGVRRGLQPVGLNHRSSHIQRTLLVIVPGAHGGGAGRQRLRIWLNVPSAPFENAAPCACPVAPGPQGAPG